MEQSGHYTQLWIRIDIKFILHNMHNWKRGKSFFQRNSLFLEWIFFLPEFLRLSWIVSVQLLKRKKNLTVEVLRKKKAPSDDEIKLKNYVHIIRSITLHNKPAITNDMRTIELYSQLSGNKQLASVDSNQSMRELFQLIACNFDWSNEWTQRRSFIKLCILGGNFDLENGSYVDSNWNTEISKESEFLKRFDNFRF